MKEGDHISLWLIPDSVKSSSEGWVVSTVLKGLKTDSSDNELIFTRPRSIGHSKNKINKNE